MRLTQIQSMTMATMEEVLDALAGVVLSYLDKVGEKLAMGVEASGRSSAHCNILDCLHAVEQCTAGCQAFENFWRNVCCGRYR